MIISRHLITSLSEESEVTNTINLGFSVKIKNSINKGFNNGMGEKTELYLSKKGQEMKMKEKKVEEEYKMESDK